MSNTSFMNRVMSSTLGVIFAFVVMGILGTFLLFSAGVFSDGGDEFELSEASILKLDLNTNIVERQPKKSNTKFAMPFFQDNEGTGLDRLKQNIEKASVDPLIKGIYINIEGIGANMAVLKELRNALVDFKDSGKFIIAYGKSMNQGAYYIASVADKVYINPLGDLDFKGLSVNITFYKRLMDKLGVEMQIIRPNNNKFKSAVEPYIYEEMSPSNREQLSLIINSLWNEMVDDISISRGLSPEELNRLADELVTSNTTALPGTGLIDGLRYRSDLAAELADSLGVESAEDLRLVGLSDYRKHEVDEYETPSYKVKDRIAVIFAEGEIRNGQSEGGTMGAETIREAVRAAREDRHVKAIVLRVNSPGGDAMASDIMWHELEMTKEEKPVVVSMSGLAASGGYYISCNADYIFANPTTITGSIGVFGMVPNAQKLLEETIGITSDTVNTNRHSGMGGIDRPLDSTEMALVQTGVTAIYDTFLLRVANGRGMTPEEVDAIGQGRVWAGVDALEIGLVDELGGLEDALEHAAELAELEEYRTKYYPAQKDPFEELFKPDEESNETVLAKKLLGEWYSYYESMKWIQEADGVYARMPYLLEIK